ncbi:MAG: hypothetical protein UZ22_OP11002000821 [Microgenomates bacterium OLB23]|nr:MAG: hypothetical protein UZ22_OP11002000821 [Microgenomates bacterium OLB23]
MELQDELNDETVVVEQPRGFQHHLIYSVLPFVVVVGSLFIGKLAVDYMSREDALQAEVLLSGTPTPEPTLTSPTTAIKISLTPEPSVRPTDPIINDTQRRYTNGSAGISFLYPKGWNITHEVYTYDNRLELVVGDVTFLKNPLDHFSANVVRRPEEKLTIDNAEGKIIVSTECDNQNDSDGSTCQGIFGTIRVYVQKGEDDWFIEGYSVKNPADVDTAIQKMKDLLSTVKFL